jgi:DNA-binding MarR family transcriptional regulator
MDDPAAPPDPRFRILNWIGIIAQLQEHLGEHALQPLGLSISEFVLLNHLSHRPAETPSIMQIARARQQPQPGISKQLARLAAKGLVELLPHPDDRRSKLVRATAAGMALHQRARRLLSELAAPPFRDFAPEELERLFAQLDRLKRWFDANRPQRP